MEKGSSIYVEPIFLNSSSKPSSQANLRPLMPKSSLGIVGLNDLETAVVEDLDSYMNLRTRE